MTNVVARKVVPFTAQYADGVITFPTKLDVASWHDSTAKDSENAVADAFNGWAKGQVIGYTSDGEPVTLACNVYIRRGNGAKGFKVAKVNL